MLLGPVFHAELVTTSRRRRNYAVRLVYGLALLAVIGLAYQQMLAELRLSGELSALRPSRLADVAMLLFGVFLVAQVAAVLGLTPAIVAGAIAGERQRRTLPHLLASRLSGFEIVVGKLAARMLQVVVLVLVGLPVLSILTLFGGLDPMAVVAAFAGTLTTAFAVAGMAIFVSALMRRPRDAIVVTYLLEFLWLAGPTVAGELTGPARSGPIRVPGGPITWLDPFQLVHLVAPAPGLFARLGWIAAGQVAVGLTFVALAVWRLRRTPANLDKVGIAGSGRPWRLFALPPVSDDPMAWKERHVARLGPVLRSIGMIGAAVSAVFLAAALFKLARPAFAELAKFGYGDSPAVLHGARDELNGAIATAGAAIGMIAIVGIALTAAAGIPSERDGDTWISLLATPLTGDEILRGKALGALRRWRFAGIAAVGLWTFGLVAGAIHPLGYALTLALFASYTAFALALGSFVSLHARNATRAVVWTVAVLFLLNGGYLMCLFPLAGRVDGFWLTAPIMPYILHVAPQRYAPVQVLFGHYPTDNINLRFDTIVSAALTCAVSLVGYGIAAVALGGLAFDSFDRAADRPRRPPGYSAALAEALEAADTR